MGALDALAPETAAAASSNGIEISQQAFDHVIEGHTVGGTDAAGNSIFSGGEDEVANLIQGSQTSYGFPQGGTTAYLNYGQQVGYLSSGQYTFIYSVIVDAEGNLVTAFPGCPLR